MALFHPLPPQQKSKSFKKIYLPGVAVYLAAQYPERP